MKEVNDPSMTMVITVKEKTPCPDCAGALGQAAAQLYALCLERTDIHSKRFAAQSVEKQDQRRALGTL